MIAKFHIQIVLSSEWSQNFISRLFCRANYRNLRRPEADLYRGVWGRSPQSMCLWAAANLGRPIKHIFTKILTNVIQNLYKINTKWCFPMYFGPWDVSGIVNRTSDINFALGISRNDHTNIGKLIFQQFSTIFNKMFKMCINKPTKGTIDQISIKTW